MPEEPEMNECAVALLLDKRRRRVCLQFLGGIIEFELPTAKQFWDDLSDIIDRLEKLNASN